MVSVHISGVPIEMGPMKLIFKSVLQSILRCTPYREYINGDCPDYDGVAV